MPSPETPPEVPDIETFKPVSSYRAMGLGFVSMRNPEGVRLDLSEAGAEAVDQNESLGPLMARMGSFIARYGKYDATMRTAACDREPCSILQVSESRQQTALWGPDRDPRFASVYRPDAAPGVIIKTYDYLRRSAGLQFYLGAWLHRQLDQADTNLKGSAQLAILQAPGRSGHRTAVMDAAPGNSLDMWLRTYPDPTEERLELKAAKAAVSAAAETAGQTIRAVAGWRGALLANDVENGGNLIIARPENVTADNLADQELTVIDQPSARFFSMPGLLAARHVPVLSRLSPEEPAIAQSPATSS